MNRNVKIIIYIAIMLVVLGVILGITFKNRETYKKSDKLTIVTTTFSTYDFAKQIAGDKADVIFLLGPGVDSHSYEPSASDLVKIQNADMFVYIGGEMENGLIKF